LLDLAPLTVASKSLPPVDQQLPNESLRLWDRVTQAILAKQYSKATSIKQELEEEQRELARERVKTGATWTPVYFEPTRVAGKPELSAKGIEVVRRAQQGDWSMAGVGS
jgi:oxysterol-binding protein-related protein 9/10/11